MSLDYEVGNAERAVAALSSASGVPMRAEGPVATEVVFLKVENRPLADVMTSLARVVAADWEKKPDGTYVLARSQTRIASETNKSVQRRLAILRKAQSAWVESLKISYDPKNLRAIVKQRFEIDEKRGDNEDRAAEAKLYTTSRELERVDPLCRAFARCIRGLDLTPVARLSYGDSLVFSTDPFPSQRALPVSALESVTRLLPEQLVWGPALSTQPLREGEEVETRFSKDHDIKFFETEDFPSNHEAWERTVPYKTAPRVALLKFTRWDGDRYGINMMLLTGTGKIVLQYSPEDFENEYFDYRSPEPDPKLPKVEASLETKALWKRGNGETSADVFKDLARFLDEPVTNDPLWLGNQELLSAYAKFKGKSLIACIHDESRFDYGDELSLTEFLASRERSITEAGAIIEVRPIDVVDHWANRTDRNLVSACIKAYRANGRLDLFTYAKLIASRSDLSESSYLGFIAQCPDPEYQAQIRTFDMGHPPYFTQLLASLSPDQLARITKGETLAYRSLTPAQQAIAYRIVQFGPVNAQHEGQVKLDAAYYEPTLELTEGLLQGTGISGVTGDDELAVFYNDEKPPWNTFRVENLTHPVEWGVRTGPGPRLPAGGMVNAKIGFHTQRYITLKCGLTGDHTIVCRMAEPMGPPKAKPVVYKMLSAEDQAKVKEFVEPRRGG